jgi:hypothetical protein
MRFFVEQLLGLNFQGTLSLFIPGNPYVVCTLLPFFPADKAKAEAALLQTQERVSNAAQGSQEGTEGSSGAQQGQQQQPQQCQNQSHHPQHPPMGSDPQGPATQACQQLPQTSSSTQGAGVLHDHSTAPNGVKARSSQGGLLGAQHSCTKEQTSGSGQDEAGAFVDPCLGVDPRARSKHVLRSVES